MFPLMFESLSFVAKTGSLYWKRMVVYYVPVALLMLICLKKPNASKWRNPTLVRSLYFKCWACVLSSGSAVKLR